MIHCVNGRAAHSFASPFVRLGRWTLLGIALAALPAAPTLSWGESPASPASAAPATAPATAPAVAVGPATNPVPGAIPATSPGSPEKQAAIRHLLDLTGSNKLGIGVLDQIFEELEQHGFTIPPDVRSQLEKELNPDAMTDLMIPIYDRHLTDDEVADLVKFYESPVGRKLVKSLPQINMDVARARLQWGQQAARKIVQELQAKGLAPGQSGQPGGAPGMQPGGMPGQPGSPAPGQPGGPSTGQPGQ